jgi:hypothetical protein
VELADDGTDGDALPGDGVYTARFAATDLAGAYSFDVQVVNENGVTFAGEPLYESAGAPITTEQAPPFTRLTSGTAVVSGDNTAPSVLCGGDVVVGCDGGSLGFEVTATVEDLEGDALTVTWIVDGDVARIDQVPGNPAGPVNVSLVLQQEATAGLHQVEVSADDGLATGRCERTVTVADGTAPSLDVDLSRTELWPPNHKYVEIFADVLVGDDCDPEASFTLVSITSNEPDCCFGDGDVPNDIAEADFGTPDTQFLLRAERDPDGTGRKYTIIYEATDSAGNVRQVEAGVSVPHDQGGHARGANGFNADGTAFVPGVTSALLLVGGESAPLVDEESVQIGNTFGTVDPLATWPQDVDGDGSPDLVAEFPVAAIEALVAVSGGESVGLVYVLQDETGHVVPDIFALGPPAVVTGSTGVSGSEADVKLYRPAPNPFRGDSRFRYSVPAEGAPVRIEVFDVAGRRVRELVSGTRPAGVHEAVWDGRDGEGRAVPAGVYFYRARIGAEERILRVIRLR